MPGSFKTRFLYEKEKDKMKKKKERQRNWRKASWGKTQESEMPEAQPAGITQKSFSLQDENICESSARSGLSDP